MLAPILIPMLAGRGLPDPANADTGMLLVAAALMHLVLTVWLVILPPILARLAAAGRAGQLFLTSRACVPGAAVYAVGYLAANTAQRDGRGGSFTNSPRRSSPAACCCFWRR